MKHGKKYVDSAKLVDRSHNCMIRQEALGSLCQDRVQQSLTKPLKSM